MSALSVFLSIACVLFAPPQANGKQLLFDAPKDASDEDRKAAAKALAARCVAHGMAGVKGDAIHRGPNIPKQIRILAPVAFTPGMISAIDWLATFQGRDLELRFQRELSAAEKEEFPVEEKSPKAHSWVRLRDWETVAAPFVHLKPSKQELCYLFPDKPGLKTAGHCKVHRHGGGDLFGEFNAPGVFLVFRDALAKALYAGIVPKPDDPDNTMLPAVLLLDGHKLPIEEGRFQFRTVRPAGRSKNPDLILWEIPATAPVPLTYLLEHPLPFSLKRIE
jgi:hypothetical protein